MLCAKLNALCSMQGIYVGSLFKYLRYTPQPRNKTNAEGNQSEDLQTFTRRTPTAGYDCFRFGIVQKLF